MKAKWNGNIETLGQIAAELGLRTGKAIDAGTILSWELRSDWPCDRVAHYVGRKNKGGSLSISKDYFLPIGSTETLISHGFPKNKESEMNKLRKENQTLMERLDALESALARDKTR